MEPSKKKRLLFVHADNSTPRRTRSKSFDSKVRRHLMLDIGKSRRKPSKAPQFVTLVWPTQTPQARPSDADAEDSTTRNEQSMARLETLMASQTTKPPLLQTLAVFEREWGEDLFSAYGFTLIMVAGKNAMGSVCSTDTFWFPFAFKKSAFLHHYRQIFTSPDVLIPLYRKSAGELKSLALERSLDTIQCVESRLASPDPQTATSDAVINAVLALVCYNFASLFFDQALIHLKGLCMVIAARGGLSTMAANHDLMVMLSWVDITAALLHDTKPLFPLSEDMASASVFRPGFDMLPAPLLSIIDDEHTQNTRFMQVLSCMGDLNAVAALLYFELATKSDAIWEDEEQMGFIINPVTHHLLEQPRDYAPITRSEIISEALRLGAIIWIIRVKRRCRSYPGTARERISSLLQLLLRKNDDDEVWSSADLRLIRLWLLVLCGISDPTNEDLARLLGMIASDMRHLELSSWDEMMSRVRQMPWVEIYEPPCAKLGEQLQKDHQLVQDEES